MASPDHLFFWGVSLPLVGVTLRCFGCLALWGRFCSRCIIFLSPSLTVGRPEASRLSHESKSLSLPRAQLPWPGRAAEWHTVRQRRLLS